MSSQTYDSALEAEELYGIAVSWGTMIGTWVFMLTVCVPSFKLRTIGGGPKWHRSGQPAHRGAASRVQGESILDTVVTLGVGFEDEEQLGVNDISRHGSTEC